MKGKTSSDVVAKRTLIDAFAGATAEVFARTAVAPIDRVKLMVQLGRSIPTTSTSHDSPIQIFRRIIRTEGYPITMERKYSYGSR